MDGERGRLRTTFGDAPELYDQARPRYPDAVVDHVLQLTGIGSGSRVLEIGPGTGQLTLPLARTGAAVTAVELSPALAAIARVNLAAHANVEIIVADFDAWPLPEQPFDAVVCATAFHWLDPDTRVDRVAASLRPGGIAAIVSTEHVAGGTESFFRDVQACYERWDPATPAGLELQPADRIAAFGELRSSDAFEAPAFRRHEWDIDYATGEYIRLLLTYSGHRALEADARAGLLDCIRDLIDSTHGGRITKRYLAEVAAARRRPPR